MGKMERYEKLQALREEEKQLRKKIDDLNHMIATIESGNNRTFLEVGNLQYSLDKAKGELEILKDRQQWLIDQQNLMKGKIDKALKTTLPGDKK